MRQNETEKPSPAWKWTAAKERAAVMIAEDEQTDEAIAKACGTTRATLARWKVDEEFQARVTEHLAELRKTILRFPVAKAHKVMARINEDWELLQEVRNLRRSAMVERKAIHDECVEKLGELIPQREGLRQEIDALRETIAKDKKLKRVDEQAEARVAELETELGDINKVISAIEKIDPGEIPPEAVTGEIIETVTYTKAGRVIEWATDTNLLRMMIAHEDEANKVKAGYVERVEHSGPGGNPIEVSDAGLPDDIRADRIVAILDRARARRAKASAGEQEIS